ncbi:MAG: LamG-like jellyroll fold domain-containing protein [Paludibacter sp.]
MKKLFNLSAFLQKLFEQKTSCNQDKSARSKSLLLTPLLVLMVLMPGQKAMAKKYTDYPDCVAFTQNPTSPLTTVDMELWYYCLDSYYYRARNLVVSYSNPADTSKYIPLFTYTYNDVNGNTPLYYPFNSLTVDQHSTNASIPSSASDFLTFGALSAYTTTGFTSTRWANTIKFNWDTPPCLAGKDIKIKITGEWIENYNNQMFNDNSLASLLPDKVKVPFTIYKIYKPTNTFKPVTTFSYTPASNGKRWLKWKNNTVGGISKIVLYSDANYKNKVDSAIVSATTSSTKETDSIMSTMYAENLSQSHTYYTKQFYNISGPSSGTNFVTHSSVGTITHPGYKYPMTLKADYNAENQKVSLTWVAGNTSGQDVVYYVKDSVGNILNATGINGGSYDVALNVSDNWKNIKYTVYAVPISWGNVQTCYAELSSNVTVSTTPNPPDFTKFTLTGTPSYNGKDAYIEVNWGPMYSKNKVTLYHKASTSTVFRPIDIPLKQQSYTANTTNDNTVIDNSKHYYYLDVDVFGKKFTSRTDSQKVEKKVTFKSIKASKNTISDRINLSWEIDNLNLCDRFEIYRSYSKDSAGKKDVDSAPERVQLLSPQTTFTSWDDMTAAPGVVYKYYISAYKTGWDVVKSTSDIGFRMPVGTVTGRVTYGSGTAVSQVALYVNSSSLDDNLLYKSIQFIGSDLQHGDLALTKAQHGCVKNGFTFQTWMSSNRPTIYSPVFEVYKEYSIGIRNDSVFAFIGAFDLKNPTLKCKLDSVAENTYFHLTVSLDKNDSLKIYINGKPQKNAFQKLKNHISTCEFADESFNATTGKVTPRTKSYFASKTDENVLNVGYYNGYIDDVRLWSTALISKDIAENYNRYLGGNEVGLIGYWPLDEGINSSAFDCSKTAQSFNEHHITFTEAHTSTNVPSQGQLWIKGITDSDGNYIIRGIPFSGSGSTFQIQPVLGTHQFEPQQQLRYISPSSLVHNGTDFTDISSFKISGKICYKNTNYPVEGVDFMVDGSACMRDNKKLVSLANGTYEIDVPIGEHKISLFKNGHKFTDAEVSMDLKMDQKFVFKENRSNINFTDLTTVTLVGRVVGGAVQAAKPIGFNRSYANIGQAKVMIQPVNKESYQLNYKQGDSLVYANINGNIKSVSKVANGNDIVIITTDSTNGEFSVQIPPIPMVIIDVNTKLLNKTPFNLDRQPNIVSDPNIICTDTIHYLKKTTDNKYVSAIDSTVYNKRLDLVYQAPSAEFTIRDTNYSWGTAFGDSIYNYKDLNNPLNDKVISLVTQNKITKALSFKFTYPVFTNGNSYSFEVKGYEKYTHPLTKKEDLVPLAGKTFQIENKLSTNTDKTSYTFDANGTYNYQFMAGSPLIKSPYKMSMTATLNYGNGQAWMNGSETGITGIVLGAVPKGGVDFVTKGPDKLICVLRDPPGSNSFSTLEKGSTFTKSHTYNKTTAQSQNAIATLHIGVDEEVGFGVMTKIEAKFDLGLGIDQQKNWSDSHTETETTTFKESISTSSNNDYVGADGDVYIANSSNLKFGKCTEVAIVPDGNDYILKDNDSYIFAKGDSTAFRYTQYHIVNKLLPNLRSLRESILKTVNDTSIYVRNEKYSKYLTTLSSTDPNYGVLGFYNWVTPKTVKEFSIDSVQFFTNQIKQWERIIRQNEIEKLRAMGTNVLYNSTDDRYSNILYTKSNLSFDAGAVLSQSTTRISSSLESNEVDWQVQFWNKSLTSFKIGGNGASAETETKAGGGGATTNGTDNVKTVTYSYTLADGDTGNYFSVDVYSPGKDPDIPKTNVIQEGSPIFSLSGGQSSCPYEKGDMSLCYKDGANKSVPLSKGGTVQIEDPNIAVIVPTVTGVASGKQATFELNLTNLAETNTACWFKLYVDPKTNPRGAILSIDGTPLTDQRLYLIAPNSTLRKTVRLTQSSTDDLEFSNIRLKFQSPCDSTIYDDAFISASFVASCSDLTMEINNRVINADSPSPKDLSVKLKDFDTNYKNFAGIILQYKGLNELDWRLAKEFVLDSVKMKPTTKTFIKIGKTDNGIEYKFPMAAEPDQTYQFRARSICANDKYNESEIINVIKDTQKPFSMGVPSPSNGILTPETEISVTFNENIQTEKIVDTDVQVWGVLNGQPQSDNVGLLFDGAQQASTELPINLQGSSFTIEGKFLANAGNLGGSIFSLGDGKDKIDMQMNGDNLNVIVGSDFSKQIVLNPDPSFQYFGLTYDALNKKLTLMLWSTANSSKSELFSEVLPNGIAPAGRLFIGKNYKGSIRQLSIWSEMRSFATINVDRSKTITGKELNLAGYWAMDEGYGKLAADKARGRNLNVNSSWFITPKGYAAELNGSNQIVAKSSHTPITNEYDFTLEFWFKGPSGQKNATLYSCGDSNTSKGLSVAFNEEGSLTVASNNNSFIVPSGDVLDNVWHHFALSLMRGGNANIYIDGNSKYQTSATNFAEIVSDSIALGARRSFINWANKATYDYHFIGSLDEVRIWKSALTSENISLNMHSKLAGNETGLAAYYPFENFNPSNVIVSSLDDALIPLPKKDLQNGGTAIGQSVTFSENTPAIKANRPRVKVKSKTMASDNKIIIGILNAADTIENCNLEFTVERIMDLNSNRMAGTLSWTAFVSMNRLKWQTESINLTKEVLAPLTFDATISNSSGNYENYVISGLPGWLTVNKTQGTINPMEKTTLIFTVNPSTNVGDYECDIRLTGSKNIDEILPVILKVTGTRPDWTVNPYDYGLSMNVIGKIQIGEVGQEDPEDMLAAFIGNRCAGIVHPQFDKTKNAYLFYMDVYAKVEELKGLDANNKQIPLPVKFNLWDASTGRIYPGVDVHKWKSQYPVDTVKFVDGTIEGDVVNQMVFNATDKIEQQLNMKKGWNWISTNVVNPNLIDQFTSGLATVGEQIKTKEVDDKNQLVGKFISYSDGYWNGTLDNVNQKTMYMLKTNDAITLKLEGAMAKPADIAIPIKTGWNYISYVPQFVAPVKDALSGLTAIEGDQIKGQIGFATYTGGTWYGSLQYMMPGLGYMYNSKDTKPDFKYPSQYISQSKVLKQAEETADMKWTMDINKYQMSMTVTGVASVDNAEVANTDMQMAVFVGNECRGSATLKYVDTNKRYLAFMMVWGNMDDVNKKITFRSYNPTNNQELSLADQSLTYVPDNIIGSVINPYKISFITSGTSEIGLDKLNVYPNPVSDVLHFDCNPSDIQQLEVIDNLGRRLVSYSAMTKNAINVGNLVPGVYTLRIKLNGKVSNLLFVRK